MILDKLQRLGIHVSLANGGRDLFVEPRNKITPDIRERVIDQKAAIIKELRTKPKSIHVGPFAPMKLKCAKRAIVTFVIGDAAEEIAEFTLPRMRTYAKKVDAVLVVIRDDQSSNWPIGNKLRFGEIAQNFGRTLLLDCDIWINDHAPDIFACHGKGAWMHSDVHFVDTFGVNYLTRELSLMAAQHDLEVIHRSTDFPRPALTWYEPPSYSPMFCNTGVVLVDRQVARLWYLPQQQLSLSHTAEQAWIDLMLSNQVFINRLESEWNWLAFGRQFDSKKHLAYFVHLANKSHDDRMQLLQQLSKEKTNDHVLH